MRLNDIKVEDYAEPNSQQGSASIFPVFAVPNTLSPALDRERMGSRLMTRVTLFHYDNAYIGSGIRAGCQSPRH